MSRGPKTIGTNLDSEYDRLFRELCRLNGLCQSDMLKQIVIPVLDDYKRRRDAVLIREFVTEKMKGEDIHE